MLEIRRRGKFGKARGEGAKEAESESDMVTFEKIWHIRTVFSRARATKEYIARVMEMQVHQDVVSSSESGDRATGR